MRVFFKSNYVKFINNKKVDSSIKKNVRTNRNYCWKQM